MVICLILSLQSTLPKLMRSPSWWIVLFSAFRDAYQSWWGPHHGDLMSMTNANEVLIMVNCLILSLQCNLPKLMRSPSWWLDLFSAFHRSTYQCQWGPHHGDLSYWPVTVCTQLLCLGTQTERNLQPQYLPKIKNEKT